MPKCPLTSVPGYEESKGITNPGLEVRINQVFDKSGQINLPFNRNQWMELYGEVPLSKESNDFLIQTRKSAKNYKSLTRGLDKYSEGEQLPLPMGRKDWYDLYDNLPRSKRSKDIFKKIKREVSLERRNYRPREKTKEPEYVSQLDSSRNFIITSKDVEPGASAMYKLKSSPIYNHTSREGMQITSVNVDRTLRRKGIAYRMYVAAFDDAKRRGLPLYSDDTLTEAALEVFKKMKEMGYKVYLSDDIVESPVPNTEGQKQFYTESGNPVVTIITR